MARYITRGDHSFMGKSALSSHFFTENTIYDFLFVFLDEEAFLKWDLLLKERICSKGANSFLYIVDLYVQETASSLERVSIYVKLRCNYVEACASRPPSGFIPDLSLSNELIYSPSKNFKRVSGVSVVSICLGRNIRCHITSCFWIHNQRCSAQSWLYCLLFVDICLTKYMSTASAQ